MTRTWCLNRFAAMLLAALSAAPFVAPAQERSPTSPAASPKSSPATADDSAAIPSFIFDYMARPEPDYQWLKISSQPGDGVETTRIDFSSQKWQGIVWKHSLTVIEPKELEDQDHVIIFVAGGAIGDGPRAGDVAAGTQIAKVAKMRVAVLQNVPNQPLFDGRKEDDLITESWLRYLETGDATWPLLFPMAKSAVKAMDVVQEFCEGSYGKKPKSFFITGLSKRGWTSWLTPVVDSRIKATAPMVIDVLNFRPQMDHQLEVWGAYSEQIADYTSKGLIRPEPGTPREELLLKMMDPYTYRSRLELPKLIVVGSNDPYWVLDATRFYWNDLVGPKNAIVIPNAGHNLDNKQGGRELALSTVAVHFRTVAKGGRLPEIDFKQEGNLLQVSAEKAPKFMRGWVAFSPTKDFREATWKPVEMKVDGAKGALEVPQPSEGHVAWFAECGFESEGSAYSLCTLMQFK